MITIDEAKTALNAVEMGLSPKEVSVNVTECCKEALRFFITEHESYDRLVTKTPNLSSSHED